MELQKTFHNLLMTELRRIQEECQHTGDSEEMLYHFSAAYGTIGRIMNFNCDRTLVFAHQILQQVHQALTNRVKASKAPGAEAFVAVPKEMLTSLLDYFEELVSALATQQPSAIYSSLEKMANLAYATSGNGYYLYSIGRLVLPKGAGSGLRN